MNEFEIGEYVWFQSRHNNKYYVGKIYKIVNNKAYFKEVKEVDWADIFI